MNCIFLLLLLSCCGGFGADSRSGGSCGCDGSAFSDNNGYGRSNNSSRGNGNNIRNGFPAVGSNGGCQEATPFSGNNCGCGDNNQGNRSISDGNPSNWQDYPEISRRDNCDSCEQ